MTACSLAPADARAQSERRVASFISLLLPSSYSGAVTACSLAHVDARAQSERHAAFLFPVSLLLRSLAGAAAIVACMSLEPPHTYMRTLQHLWKGTAGSRECCNTRVTL